MAGLAAARLVATVAGLAVVAGLADVAGSAVVVADLETATVELVQHQHD